jgi:arginyl-tRNA synthetase
MSTRAGQFETLADVVREVGPDAARFIFLTRKSDSKLDFDLELVKERSMANPVFYVQYAHARICSLFRKATEQDAAAGEMDEAALAGLTTPEDILLLKALERFPESVDAAARTLSPHHVCYQLQELAGALHRYYTANPVLTAPDPDLLRGRLHLMAGVRRVLAIGLGLLGVEAPERMDERPEEAAPETS